MRRNRPHWQLSGIVGVDAVHVVAFFVGHHLERELVVVAQEERPLARLGDGGRLREDVDEREAILHVERHEESRHQREVECHVALVALPEVGDGVLGPLVGLREEHAVLEALVDVLAHCAQKVVRLGKVLAVRSFPLEEVRDGVEP